MRPKFFHRFVNNKIIFLNVCSSKFFLRKLRSTFSELLKNSIKLEKKNRKERL